MKFKIDIGTRTEDEVQASVEGAFSPLFVFRAPRKEDQDEVTDVLVLWHDVGLVMQVKAQALDPSGQGSQKDALSWARKNLAKAGRQVAGAVRAIRDGRLAYMENPPRGRVPFPRTEVKWLYGIIILHHDSAPYDPFELVPELQRTSVPLHILSFRDFWNLAQFLNTPGDLVNYLEDRSEVLLPTLKPRVHEEEGVFAYHLENLENLLTFRAQRRGFSVYENDVRPYAQHLRRLLEGDLPDANVGLVIDHMIGKVHEHDPSLGELRYGEDVIECRPDSIRIATVLSMIPRVRRIALGKSVLRAVVRADEKQDDDWTTTYSRSRSDCILFLASPLPRNQRDERRKRLLSMTAMLKHCRQVNKAIGIATEAGDDAGCSYDFVYLEYEPVENKEAFLAAKELFGEVGRPLTEELLGITELE
ncbi:MAG TPA: hypothetical protein VF173_28060 [Thermoanaerobaculia bacterium]|nr:hypothetical protein [Thermoanaerobaculia bacterium]